MTKTGTGNFFEDYRLGQQLIHATPRTVTVGDRSLYGALYPNRFALHSSDEFARNCGLPASPLDELVAFHVVFGKSVPDISLNAVANLGYAEGRFLKPVFPGDTLSATSEVIGLKENSSGKTGIVWVRTSGDNQRGETVVTFCRWVMVRKRDPASMALGSVMPELANAVKASDLTIPEGLDFSSYSYSSSLSGSCHFWDDYQPGEKIDHVDGCMLEEAEHMMATRLWQNTARVHFDPAARDGAQRLIYGGHIISMARALSFNGLGNAQLIAGINSGAHAAPCTAGDTVYSWSEVLDKAETAVPSVGALRLRLVAVKNAPAGDMILRGADGKFAPGVALDFDYWALMPRR